MQSERRCNPRDDAPRETIGRYVQKQIGGDLIERLVQECGAPAAVPPELECSTADTGTEEIQDRILEELDERPPRA